MNITRTLLATLGAFVIGCFLYGAKAEPVCGKIADLPDIEVVVLLKWVDGEDIEHKLYTDREHNMYVLSWPEEGEACFVLRGRDLQFNDRVLQEKEAGRHRI